MRLEHLRSILILLSCVYPLTEASALETAPPVPQQSTAAAAAGAPAAAPGVTTPVAGVRQAGSSVPAAQAQPAAAANDSARNGAGLAPTGAAQAGHPAAAAVACPTAEELQQVTVTDAFLVIPEEPKAVTPEQKEAAARKEAAWKKKNTLDGKPIVNLRDAIGVTVNNLETLFKLEACSPEHRKIVLFLDRRALVDLKPYPRADPKQNVLFFLMQRSETSRDVWTYLLGKPSVTPRPVQVSVGLEDGYALPSSDAVIMLRALPIGWSLLWLAAFVVLVGTIIWLSARYGMLRDIGQAPAGAAKAYSLGRVQLAIWTVLVIGGYLFIGLTTGDYASSITDSVLGLMGISAGTAIGASLIDMPSRADANAGPVQPVVAPPTTGHWYLDILSDGTGINFHRYQIFAWTIVLGVIYIHQVYRDLAMPDFSASLLAMMGISSGTYLGLKITTE